MTHKIDSQLTTNSSLKIDILWKQENVDHGSHTNKMYYKSHYVRNIEIIINIENAEFQMGIVFEAPCIGAASSS